MKNPTVFEGNFVPLGLMEILLSFPSSFLTSIANRSNLSLTKQSLRRTNKYLIKAESMHTIIISTYSEAWENVMPVKVGDNVSVYISQPVPCK